MSPLDDPYLSELVPTDTDHYLTRRTRQTMPVLDENEENRSNADADIEYKATYQDRDVKQVPSTDGTSSYLASDSNGVLTSFEDSQADPEPEQSMSTSMSMSQSESREPRNWSVMWTEFVRKLHIPSLQFLQLLSSASARNPRTTVALTTFIAFFFLIVGFATNFNISVDEEVLWTPQNSDAARLKKWINHDSGFLGEPRWFILMLHDDGKNVLGKQQVRQMFEVLDTIRSVEGYDEMCKFADFTDMNGVETCEINGAVQFWNMTTSVFEEKVTSDEDCIQQMSAHTFPDQFPVADEVIFGFPKRDKNGTLTFSMSYSIFIKFPHVDSAPEVEERALKKVLALNDKYRADPSSKVYIEVAAERSFADEFTRAIINDIFLVPVVAILMSTFIASMYWKKDRVRSRTMLGLCEVFAVLLSIMASYGIMFCAGVPFTSVTQMLPFILFGCGVDDSFVIYGSFVRTSPKKSIEERIRETIDDCGVSITLTTATSALAFALSCNTSIPAIYWVSLYAGPAVAMVYFYQLTFFVACIVLDQRRVEARKMDCCSCITVSAANQNAVSEHYATRDTIEHLNISDEWYLDRIMESYARFIMRPWVKVVIIVAFTVFAGLCAWSATFLHQEFKFKDVLPKDSYITTFIQTRMDYSSRSHLLTFIYFRDVNQSDPYIQEQMLDFVDNITHMESVTGPPDLFWLRDFDRFVDNFTLVEELPFDKQLAVFFSFDIAKRVYGSDVLRDEDGHIIASRCMIDMGNIEVDDVKGQIHALQEQRRITWEQPVNEGRKEEAFFTYSRTYDIWEFYEDAPYQLMFSSFTGVFSVTVIALMLIPHWTAGPIVLVMMCVLYVDLLGIMQWGGVTINPVSYICLAMSIGLLVDFVMHVLLKYYESPGTRPEKCIHMLSTMGSSVFFAGFTTFLGTIPLAFSTSAIFYIIFIGFLGIVVLGLSHGLILLPVILSLVGTEDQVTTAHIDHSDEAESGSMMKTSKDAGGETSSETT